MPFGLMNAPHTFQHTRFIIFSSEEGQSALVHLGDIIIFTEYADEHIDHGPQLLALLNDTGVTLKVNKC